MATVKCKGTFKGVNGHAGFLTDETYDLVLTRDTGSEYPKHAGLLRIEREQSKEEPEISSAVPLILESDEEIFTYFDIKDKVDFGSVAEAKVKAAAVEEKKQTAFDKVTKKVTPRAKKSEEPKKKVARKKAAKKAK